MRIERSCGILMNKRRIARGYEKKPYRRARRPNPNLNLSYEL